MKRTLTGGLLATAAVCAVVAPATNAGQCTFCNEELEAGVNPLKCPRCVEKAEKIARGNQRVWVLDFKPGKIGRVQLKDDTGDVENYWFLPYTLKNKDEHPRPFFIDVTARSDKGNRHHRYHDTWIPDVYDEVRKALGVRDGQQLLSQKDVCMPPPGQRNEPPPAAASSHDRAKIALPVIQPGETLQCVAMFQQFDPELDELVVRVRGLTTSSLLTHDAYVAPDGQPHRRVITEAVLELTYRRPGDEFAHGQDPISYVGRRWVDLTRTVPSDLR